MIVKILQWNIWDKENPDNIIKEIKKISPDIICAQEVIQNSKKNLDVARHIATKIKYEYFFKTAETWDNRELKTNQGNAIFSKLPIINKTSIYVQKPKHNPRRADRQGRIYLEVDIKIKTKVLTCGTTHLSFTPFFKINNHRKKEIDNLINIIKNKKENYIFTADLNATPTSYAVKQIIKYLKNAGPDFNKNTWTTKPFDYHGLFKENKLNWRLDYIFTTKDLKTKPEVLKTPYSDHLPLLLKINI